MKTKTIFLLFPVLFAGMVIFSMIQDEEYPETARTLTTTDGCVFMTAMGEQSSEDFYVYKTDENIELAVRDGLSWLEEAQLPNGGYGAGSHSRQDIRDPHAVKADPATTAMVAMAYLRSGATISSGTHSNQLKKATEYLLRTVENVNPNDQYITDVRGTQIQTKLGQNIDAVLTAQYLSSLLDRKMKGIDKKRVQKCLDICVKKIEQGTDASGKQRGAGWAGVLQSGLANSALESAQSVGAEVDEEVLERAKEYQRSNYNADTNNVKTEDGAGVMLYSVSGSVRGTAKDARKAKEAIEKAKKEGALTDGEVTAKNLQKAGYSESEAIQYATSYNVYNAAKETAQQDEVLNGFGNNGGEEFLSFLQTGESMVVNQDNDWRKWYDNMSGRILKIQNEDGSWNGHHCITSPVFCTASSLLLLTVENDISFLQKVGEE
ncbi:prenyltransferase/squalene oxidase repeat-containing protein [Luteirhabdus pelagi]|uniref:hypothetical protein n=1 Tax=Luteirhabdus pelagi TaxID=2792783 RepID=UPI001939CD0C|nr:hypothetical protein [Luteirhabdus pelagi]